MSRPRKKLIRAGRESGAVDNEHTKETAAFQGNGHQCTDGRLLSWKVPSDDADGFEVNIGRKGHIVLTQQSPFSDEAIIALHPAEVAKLLHILPSALTASLEFRKRAGLADEFGLQKGMIHMEQNN